MKVALSISNNAVGTEKSDLFSVPFGVLLDYFIAELIAVLEIPVSLLSWRIEMPACDNDFKNLFLV